MSDITSRIQENVAQVRERIAAAAERSGRNAADITFVAVTKYVGPEEVLALVESGCHDIGESRPQELWKKTEALTDQPIRWHMIGHLQRNKSARTLPLVTLLHSGDSTRLLNEVNRIGAQTDRIIPVLLEANISGDETKHGFQPGALIEALPQLAELTHMEVRGLMGMASREGGPDQARKDFSKLRELRDQLNESQLNESRLSNINLDELSMGMSNDYEVAIEEGATIVRVGSALFE